MIISLTGLMSVDFLASYVASKTGVVAYTRSMAVCLVITHACDAQFLLTYFINNTHIKTKLWRSHLCNTTSLSAKWLVLICSNGYSLSGKTVKVANQLTGGYIVLLSA